MPLVSEVRDDVTRIITNISKIYSLQNFVFQLSLHNTDDRVIQNNNSASYFYCLKYCLSLRNFYIKNAEDNILASEV